MDQFRAPAIRPPTPAPPAGGRRSRRSPNPGGRADASQVTRVRTGAPGVALASKDRALRFCPSVLTTTLHHEHEQVVRVRCRGEIDLTTASKLNAALHEAVDADGARVIVDLRAVTFMDATGITVLVEGLHECRHRGRSLSVEGPSSAVRRLIQLYGLTQSFGLREGDERPEATSP